MVIAWVLIIFVSVIPNTCHGSTDPWTYKTRLSFMFKPPYKELVLLIKDDASDKFNLI